MMKVFFYCLLVTGFAVSVTANANLKQQIIQYVTECKSETNIKKMHPKDPNFDCFVACVAKKAGVMENNKINKDKLLSYLNQFNVDVSSKLEQMNECIEKGNKEVDECKIINVTMKCGMIRGLAG